MWSNHPGLYKTYLRQSLWQHWTIPHAFLHICIRHFCIILDDYFTYVKRAVVNKVLSACCPAQEKGNKIPLTALTSQPHAKFNFWLIYYLYPLGAFMPIVTLHPAIAVFCVQSFMLLWLQPFLRCTSCIGSRTFSNSPESSSAVCGSTGPFLMHSLSPLDDSFLWAWACIKRLMTLLSAGLSRFGKKN
jgi:hypothetical protein